MSFPVVKKCPPKVPDLKSIIKEQEELEKSLREKKSSEKQSANFKPQPIRTFNVTAPMCPAVVSTKSAKETGVKDLGEAKCKDDGQVFIQPEVNSLCAKLVPAVTGRKKNRSKIKKASVMINWNEKLNQKPTFSFNLEDQQASNYGIYKDNEVNEIFCKKRKNLSLSGDYFTVFDVLNDLCGHFKVRSVMDIKTPTYKRGFFHEMQIQEAKEFQMLQNEVTTFIHAYCMASGISVLHELEKNICELTKKRNFSELQLGPLHKFPIVYMHFKMPPDATKIPSITTKDVMRSLWNYMGKNRGERVDFKKFLDYVAENYHADSAFHLGIVIGSPGLLIKMVKKAKFGEMEKRKEMEHQVQLDMEEDLEKYLGKLRQNLTKKSERGIPGASKNLMQEIAGLPIEEALMRIFTYVCEVRNRANIRSTAGIFGAANKIVDTVMEIKKSPLLVKIFHVVVATGLFHQLKKDDLELLHFLGFDKAIETIQRQESLKNALTPSAKCTNKSCIVSKVFLIKKCKECFASCQGSMDIFTLARMENNILRDCHPQSTSFESLGHGNFLQFLTRNEDLLKKLGSYVLVTPSAHRLTSNMNAKKEDMNDFIRQCKGNYNEKMLFGIFCNQFELDDQVKSLYEEFHHSYSSWKDYHKEANDNKHESTIIYQNPLLSKSTDAPSASAELCNKDAIDDMVTGWGTQEDAIKSLQSAPLLEDLHRWTNWNFIFRPKCGDLKQFIRELPKMTDKQLIQVHVLEIYPGKLLKIKPDATHEEFKKCLDISDPVNTAGILVSLIVSYGGVRNAPMALLTNYVKSFLQIKRTEGITEGFIYDQPPEKKEVRFILQCMSRIPPKLLSRIINQVFLKPLNDVFGKVDTASLLLNSCVTQEERTCLHILGVLNAVEEWITDFRNTKVDVFSDAASGSEQLIPDLLLSANDNLINDDEKMTLSYPNLNEKEVEEINEEEDQKSSKPKVKDDDDLLDIQSIEQLENDLIENDDSCKQLIENIRKNEFGIGEEFGERATGLFQAQYDRLGRTLERLSKELYSKDIHFVLELVQNADDNEYPEAIASEASEEKPAISFVIEKHCITMRNNESGFKPENIKAICDVGKTTKGVHHKGYIGQKGIGFKSIFRVTDKPEVHSNGYHIRFDAESGSIGYILPEWIGQDDYLDSYMPDGLDFTIDWQTQIVLPLKAEYQERKTSLIARFHDIHPSLLLFLNRLQIIIVDDKVNAMFSLMQKKKLGEDLVELRCNNSNSLWMVITKEIEIDVRPDIKTTDVSLAFPLDHSSQISLQAKSLPLQPVFAFLPLRSYGFKYIIQADFEVPSSREDICRDNLWNEWIIDKLPKVIADAFKSFKSHTSFSALAGATKYFRFMALEEEIHGTFRPVAGRVIKLLQSQKCIPVEVSNDAEEKEVSYEWAIPSSVLLQNTLLKNIVSPKELKECLHLHYMVKSVQEMTNPALLSALGVQALTLEHLLEMAKIKLCTVFKERADNCTHSEGSIVAWIGKWFFCVCQYLEQSHDCSTETMNKITSIKIFPLATNEWIALSNNTVFFSTAHMKDSSVKLKEKTWVSWLDKDLNTLNQSLFDELDEVGQVRVNHLLEELGVKKRDPQEIMQSHIIPIFESEQWKEKPHDLVVAYVMFIKEQWDVEQDAIDVEVLRNCLVVKTSLGLKRLCDHPVYFGPTYKNSVDFKKNFPDLKWAILCKDYLKSGNVQSWRTFFSAVGVNSFLHISKRTKTIYKDELHSSVWASCASEWPNTDDGIYLIEDVSCDQLEELIKSTNDKENRLSLLLDANWKIAFSQFNLDQKNISLKNSRNVVIGTTFSSITMLLRHHAWLQGKINNNVTLHKPSALFLERKEIRDLLSNFCPYLVPDLKDPIFLDFLGIIKEVKPEKLVDFLEEWINNPDFYTSIQHMGYVYLALKDADKKLLEDLQFKALIYIPCKDGEKTNSGRFCTKDEVCWEDPSGVLKRRKHFFRDTIKVLSHHYHENLGEFFCKTLNVRKSPTVMEYLKMTSSLVAEIRLPDVEGLFELYSIFSVIGRESVESKQNPDTVFDDASTFADAYDDIGFCLNDNMCRFVYLNAKESKIFPTKRNAFVSLEVNPFLPDKEEFYSIFKDSEGVSFIDTALINDLILNSKNYSLRSKHHPPVKYPIDFVGFLLFCKTCNIQLLSSSILPPEPKTEGLQKGCFEWEKLFGEVLCIIQRILYYKHRELHERVTQIRLPIFLSNAQIYTTGRLDVIYKIKGLSDVEVPKSSIFAYEYSDYSFEKICIYLLKGHLDEKDDIITEFVSLFTESDTKAQEEISDFVISLLPLDVEKREKKLESRKIGKVPESEKWTLPEPEKVAPAPQHSSRSVKPELKKHSGELSCWPPPAPEELYRNPNKEVVSSSQELLKEIELPAPPPRMISNSRDSRQMTLIEASSINSNSCQETDEQNSITSLRKEKRKQMQVVTTDNDEKLKDTQQPFLPIVGIKAQETDVSLSNLCQSLGQISSSSTGQLQNESAKEQVPMGPGNLLNTVPTYVKEKTSENSLILQDKCTSESVNGKGISATKTKEVVTPLMSQHQGPFHEPLPLEIAFEDINLSAKCQNEVKSLVQKLDSFPNDVGKIGEYTVYKHLLEHHKEAVAKGDIEISWQNEVEESGAPYDIKLTWVDDSSRKSTVYIEVKTTRDYRKKQFEISGRELEEAFNLKANYHLYRVSGIEDSPKIQRLKGLYYYLMSKAVQVYIIL